MVQVMLQTISKTMSRVLGTPAAVSGRKSLKTRRFRPGIEGLEGRLVPATILVNTFEDFPTTLGGQKSLRAAILDANATPGPDTILLQAGTYRINPASA